MNREKKIKLGESLSHVAGGVGGGVLGIAIGDALMLSGSSITTVIAIASTLGGLWVADKLFRTYGPKQHTTA